MFPGQTAVIQAWFPIGPVDMGGSDVGHALVTDLRLDDALLTDRIEQIGAVSSVWLEPTAAVLSITTPMDLVDQVLTALKAAKPSGRLSDYRSEKPNATSQRMNSLLSHAYDGMSMGSGFSRVSMSANDIRTIEKQVRFESATLAIVTPPTELDRVAKKVSDAIGSGRRNPVNRADVRQQEDNVSIRVERGGDDVGWILVALPVLVRDGGDAAYTDIGVNMITRRLGDALQRRGLGAVKTSFTYSPGVDSRVVLEMETTGGDIGQAWSVVLDALVDLSRAGVEPSESSKSLALTRRAAVLQDGHIEGRARRLGALAHRFGVRIGPDAYASALSDPNSGHLAKLVTNRIAIDRMRGLLVLPAKQSIDPTLYGESLTTTARTLLGRPKAPSGERLRELSDGAQLAFMERKGTGTVAISARVAGGIGEVPRHLAGAALLSAMLLEERVVGSRVRAGLDGIYLDWFGPAAEALAALASMGTALQTPTWDSELFERARRRASSSLDGEPSDSLEMALLLANGLEKASLASRQLSLRRLTSASLGGWFRAYVMDAPLAVALVGDLSAASFRARARQALTRPRLRRIIKKKRETEQVRGALVDFGERGEGFVPLGLLSPAEREAARVLTSLLQSRMGDPRKSRVEFVHRHGGDHLVFRGSGAANRGALAVSALRSSKISTDANALARQRAVSHHTIALSSNAQLSTWLIQQLVCKSNWIGKRAVHSWRAVAEGITRDEVHRLLSDRLNALRPKNGAKAAEDAVRLEDDS